MNQRNRSAGGQSPRHGFKLAPTTHAIRSALAASALVLALAGSNAALAGTCAVSGLNQVSCNGVFTDTVTDSVPVVADLTLVLGDNAPTSITPAAGDAGVIASWGGDVTVISYADITTVGADGIYQYGSETATLANYGSIATYVSAPGANAVDISANYDVSVDNDGSIAAYGTFYSVVALSAVSYQGDVEVYNQDEGSISADSYWYAPAVALTVSAYDSAVIDNAGSIEADAFYGMASGIDAVAGGDIDATNSGSIDAYSYGYHATAVHLFSYYGDAGLDNAADGVISASSAYGSAVGVLAGGDSVTVANAGEMQAVAYSGAYGVALYAYAGDASFDNDGTVYAAAVGFYASAQAVAVHSNEGDVVVDNAGTIAAYGGFAGGVIADADAGSASVLNSGTILASADVYATGVAAYGYDAVYVDNSGEVLVDTGNGLATGIYAGGTGDYSYVQVLNSGSIEASSVSGSAAGIEVRNYFNDGDIAVENTGSIEVYSVYGPGAGIFAVISYGELQIDNSGSIAAGSAYGSAVGISFGNQGMAGGETSVSNTGSILVDAAQTATGISGFAFIAGDMYVYNGGSIQATGGDEAVGIDLQTGSGAVEAVNTGGIGAYGGYSATGISLSAGYGTVSAYNSGAILAVSEYSDATGIHASVFTADIVVGNSGDVAAYGATIAYGMNLNTFGGGNIYVDNSGTIYAYGGDFAFGLEMAGYSGDGDMVAFNSGIIAASSNEWTAVAVHSESVGGDFYLYNEGALLASSVYGDAYGVQVELTSPTGDASVVNVGSVDADSDYGDATGVYLSSNSTYGVVDLDNAGSISAVAGAAATGVYLEARGLYGEATASNSGSIYASGVSYASGVLLYGGKYAGLDNSGDIYAIASNEDPNALATGAGVYSFYGEASIYNSGTITAVAYGGANSYGAATGAWAAIAGGNAVIDNAGSISAQASGFWGGSATGVEASSSLLSALVYNSGSIEAEASGLYATAVGAFVFASEFGLVATDAGSSIAASASGYYNAAAFGARVIGLFANVYGEGEISAEASADAVLGSARAYGAHVYGSFTGIYVLGDGAISATAEGAYALAVGALQDGYFTAFHNEGSISASATGDTGFAVGALTLSYYGANQYNSGDISAIGDGDGVEAVGLFALSRYGDIELYNTGSISASADFLAVAVQLESYAYTLVYNTGTIAATGAETNVAIYTPGESLDYIYNYGTITGALWLGDENDVLYNDGTWNAGQTPSDFGNGDDGIVNTGTIHLDDSVIDLGYHAVDGNFFYNYGTITVEGSNLIHMGHGLQAVVPSLNPLPFYNYGVLDFQDGEADDLLVITGDFAGDGDINVDVSGVNEVSDVLYVDGSVVTGSVNTINVELLDLPESIETLVPVVYVTGVSVASNFALGEVNWDEDNSFVSLDFSLVADIDATNATPDIFSLGIEVTGLSDPGTIAASIPGSVVSLMNAQVGTWRQRMGVIDSFSKGAIGLWARVFTDKGSFSPDHEAFNFGQGGNFDWEQKNSGVEAGIDFSVTDEFSLGLLVAKSEADVHLDNPGVGSSDLDADTWGVYGTWISPNGFYLDASYRWMSFDVDLNSVAGAMQASGDAESFNVEVGYAWTLAGGLKIEPQLQWTKTNVDNLDVLSTTTGMTFTSGGGDSSRGRLGVAIRKSFGDYDTGWQWTPYATLSAVREFDGENDYAINNTFFGSTTTEGTSALLELGFTARHQNLSIYGGLNWQDGGAINSFFGGQLGIRYTFGGSAPPPAPAPVAPAKTCADLDDDGDGVNNCDDKCLGSTAGQAVGPDGCPVPAPEPEPVMEPKPFRG